MNLVVFADLDGTLLGLDDYSYEAARDGMERIRYQQIPLIFTTSKTRLEIKGRQAGMPIREPFIGSVHDE
jgi:mannosyl-3-phosphoglycerate phosphatase